MVRKRALETGKGIQGELDVGNYDVMMRNLRDRGWLDVKSLIMNGITKGHVLEVGPGPGYLGLEWLRHTRNTRLTGVEISPAMIEVSMKNAAEYGVRDRVVYTEGDAHEMPFEDDQFDAVFSHGSLHEWKNPAQVFNEMSRILKPGGIYRVSDLKRDIAFPVKLMMKLGTKPKAIRPGLISSINAAFTVDELEELLRQTALGQSTVRSNPFGLEAFGIAPSEG
jgi:ubiquinone/menaquinone biosynthesis C-methylase UbiE